MAFQKKPQSPEPTKPPEPVDLDELFHVTAEEPTGYRPEPIVTGLSDEEDAQRLLAMRFNEDLLFCTNCEVSYDKTYWVCPRCDITLSPMGTPPHRRKVR